MLTQRLDTGLTEINNPLVGINDRLDGINNRLDEIENHIDVVDNRLDGVDSGLATLVAFSHNTRLITQNSHATPHHIAAP